MQPIAARVSPRGPRLNELDCHGPRLDHTLIPNQVQEHADVVLLELPPS
jgi:hypothetical protein